MLTILIEGSWACFLLKIPTLYDWEIKMLHSAGVGHESKEFSVHFQYTIKWDLQCLYLPE